MSDKTIMFLVTLLICVVTVCFLAVLWFSDGRNRKQLSFFVMGITVAFWLLFDAICYICTLESFPLLFTLHITALCIFTSSLLWFVLFFTGSRFSGTKAVLACLAIIAAADIVGFATNPWHHFFIREYYYPMGTEGPLFWIHAAVQYLISFVAYVLLIRHVIRIGTKKPSILISGVGMLIPLILNIFLSFHVFGLKYDLTSAGFAVVFILFAVFSFNSQLFNFRFAAVNNIYLSLNDAVLIIGPNGIITDSNPAFDAIFPAFKFEPYQSTFEEFAAFASSVTDGLSIDDWSLFDDSKNTISRRELSMEFEGTQHTFVVTKRALVERGRSAGTVLSFADVSEYKRMINEIKVKNEELIEMNEKAESATAAKSAFLANMSHEIRTPMNAIIGMNELVLKTQLTDTQRDYLVRAAQSSKSLLRIINDILDFSKIEAGKIELDIHTFNLEDVLDKVQDVISNIAQAKGVTFSVVQSQETPCFLIGDSLRLYQVLLNLANNAVKFTSKGEIVVHVSPQSITANDAVLLFAVRDTGIGMSLEQAQKVFSPFGQADASVTRKYGGTGLGLAICKSLVQLMGGEIWCKSAKGAGATFYFTVKFALSSRDDYESAREDDSAFTVPEHLWGAQILLVEDNEINQMLATELLQLEGFEVDTASNGLIAIEMLENKEYNLVLMDVQMPVMDGISAAKEIRTRKEFGSIPIIAMTAHAMNSDRELSLAAGMNDHLTKPIDAKTLYKTICKWLQEQAAPPGAL